MKFLKPSASVFAITVFSLCLTVLPQTVAAQHAPLIFSVTGDIPYGSSEETEMQQQIAEHNLYSPAEFFVHIGDIKSGSGSCSESVYRNVRDYLLQLQVPTFITPGDNEWIDCSNPPQAWNFWVQYFMNFEQNFCPVPGFQKQSVRPENFAWVQKGVLLIGVSVPGGSEGTSAKARRLQDDADWVNQQFQAHGSEVRAAVIFAHNMDTSADKLFIDQLIVAANNLGKPILYIHGSGHSWKQDFPLSAKNVMRVQVDNGGAALPVQVTVTTNNPATFVFNRNPWNSNSQPVSRPPCGQTSAPAITVNPSSHNYGQVAVGGNSSQTFVVSNSGNASLEVTNTSLTSGNAGDFGITSGGGSYILSPGQTRNVSVRFNPGSEGDKNTTLRFESNAGTKDVSLAGTGIITTTMFTLNTEVIGGGSISLDPAGGVYEDGANVSLTAIPAPDFVFSGWSGDLSGSNNPMTIVMNANKSVTATFTPSDPGGSTGTIVHQETQTGGSAGSTSVATSASLIGVSGHLYLAAISNRGNEAVTSVSGLGLTWTRVKAQCSTRGRLGLEVWKAQGMPSGNGAVTATFSATPDNAAIAVSRYSGVDAANPIGNLISGNLNGVNGTCSGGSESDAYSYNLTTTTNGAMVYGAISMRQETHTPGAGYTERADRMQGSGSNAASVAVEDRSYASAGTVIVNGSFSGAVYWAVIGLELKPQTGPGPAQYTLDVTTVGSGTVSQNPLPNNGTYSDGTIVELTATPTAGFQFSGWSGDASGTATSTTVTMNGNKSVTATFTAIPPDQYTLTVATTGSGTVSQNPLPSNGTYASGTVVELTAAPTAGFQFAGWSGDASGTATSTTVTMNGNKAVTATFTAVSSGGQIVYHETQTGSSSGSTSVTTSTSLTAASGHLYLAAISFKSNVGVSSVSGLGLTWTRVKAQCAGRNQTGVEIWMAQGTPSGNGVVTATLAATPKTAVISVSRYSGAASVNPVGNLISGNTTGANGACSGGSDNAAYSFNATTTVNGAVIYAVAGMRSHTHTPGAGYTERVEIRSSGGNSDASSVVVQERTVASPSTVAVNGSFSSTTDWAMAAVEIKP